MRPVACLVGRAAGRTFDHTCSQTCTADFVPVPSNDALAKRGVEDMSLFLRLALWVFLPSGLVAMLNFWAIRADPENWGSPTSFGSGAVQLLAYVGMVIGVAFFLAAMVERRRKRSRSG